MESNYKNSYKASDKKLVSLSVYNVGFQKCNSLHQWGPGIRDHYLIHYVISGKGFYRYNDSLYEINEGDAFLVFPNEEITYFADKDNPWEYAWVGFSGSDASTIIQATDFSNKIPIIHSISNGSQIKNQISKIYESHGNEFNHSVEMTGHLYTLLAMFISLSSNNEPENSSLIYVQKSIEYINSNYSYPITIEDIASYVGISRSHLFRSFESNLGLSPKEYLTNHRLKQACYLLANSNLSITAIANSVGFDNSLYFSKTFHKNIGMSPKEYRSNNKF